MAMRSCIQRLELQETLPTVSKAKLLKGKKTTETCRNLHIIIVIQHGFVIKII